MTKTIPFVPKAVGELLASERNSLTPNLWFIYAGVSHRINHGSLSEAQITRDDWILENADAVAQAWLAKAYRIAETDEVVHIE